MREQGYIYCIGCEQVVSRAQADMVFRTGYYKVVYPLGTCCHCTCSETPVLMECQPESHWQMDAPLY